MQRSLSWAFGTRLRPGGRPLWTLDISITLLTRTCFPTPNKQFLAVAVVPHLSVNHVLLEACRCLHAPLAVVVETRLLC